VKPWDRRGACDENNQQGRPGRKSCPAAVALVASVVLGRLVGCEGEQGANDRPKTIGMDDGMDVGPDDNTSQPVVEPVPFPLEASIPELQSAMEAGELTSVELVDFYLARIAAYDDAGPELNAFITVNPAAREQAAALDAERAASGSRGPLHGIPVVVKDNIGTADMPTTAARFSKASSPPRRLPGAPARGGAISSARRTVEFASAESPSSPRTDQTVRPDAILGLERRHGGAVARTRRRRPGTDTCGSIISPAHNNLWATPVERPLSCAVHPVLDHARPSGRWRARSSTRDRARRDGRRIRRDPSTVEVAPTVRTPSSERSRGVVDRAQNHQAPN
jgi:hypothetical protein